MSLHLTQRYFQWMEDPDSYPVPGNRKVTGRSLVNATAWATDGPEGMQNTAAPAQSLESAPASDLPDTHLNGVNFRSRLDALLAAGYELEPGPRPHLDSMRPAPPSGEAAGQSTELLTVSDLMGGPELSL